MTELKPCPFCGGEAKTVHYDGALTICCPACSKNWDLEGERPGERWAADFEFSGWSEEDDSAAIAAWNRRTIDRDELLRIADELEEPLKLEDGFDTAEELRRGIEEYERAVAELIRKAVGA